jgi:stearoyl-CoA desaturase (delta-9 desaturase)
MLFREFFSRLNVVRDRRNWMPFFSWLTVAVLAVPFTLFFTHFLTWGNFAIAFVYSMVILGTHGTVWYHRYSTHRAYRFSHPFWRFLVRNAVVKIIPEELYVVSHHVHHAISEKPGDPYNVHGGWLYCFLADAIHQPIARSMSETQYRAAVAMVEHAGVKPNTYAQYLRWGSIAHPLRTVVHFALNWAFWYGAFYLLGGHSLAVTIFASCGVWAIGVRTFNYDGHGGGKDKRQDGIDFNREDLSINQLWPRLVTGEWHNNHHLYPTAPARASCAQLDYVVVIMDSTRSAASRPTATSPKSFTKSTTGLLETKAKDRDAGDRMRWLRSKERAFPSRHWRRRHFRRRRHRWGVAPAATVDSGCGVPARVTLSAVDCPRRRRGPSDILVGNRVTPASTPHSASARAEA